MAFEKIKVANPIVEMDGKIPSLTDTIPIAPSRLCWFKYLLGAVWIW
jgi:hypothetical protein